MIFWRTFEASFVANGATGLKNYFFLYKLIKVLNFLSEQNAHEKLGLSLFCTPQISKTFFVYKLVLYLFLIYCI